MDPKFENIAVTVEKTKKLGRNDYRAINEFVASIQREIQKGKRLTNNFSRSKPPKEERRMLQQ